MPEGQPRPEEQPLADKPLSAKNLYQEYKNSVDVREAWGKTAEEAKVKQIAAELQQSNAKKRGEEPDLAPAAGARLRLEHARGMIAKVEQDQNANIAEGQQRSASGEFYDEAQADMNTAESAKSAAVLREALLAHREEMSRPIRPDAAESSEEATGPDVPS